MSKGEGSRPCRIEVGGDVIVDHNVYAGDRQHPAASGFGTRIGLRVRGAGLTAELLAALGEREPRCVVHDATGAAAHHAFATWALVPGPKGGPADVWRVSRDLGFGEVGTVPDAPAKDAAPSAGAACDLLVIDEAGLGFRNRPDTWSPLLAGGNPRWIVLKMSYPVCSGALWTRMLDQACLDRLVVIVSADDLRLSGASVSQGLSWEQSVRDLLGDLAYHAELRGMSAARHLVVNFGDDGALWLDNSDRAQPRRHLIFDPGHLEGSWREDIVGSVPGSGSCLPASVVWALCEDPANSGDLAGGIARGLAARRTLLESGHGSAQSGEPGFPMEAVLAALLGPRGGGMRMVTVPDSAAPGPPGTADDGRPQWSIIVGDPVEGHRPLMGRARAVALRGEAALSGIPFGRFGKLYTVDRIELNGFHGVRRLMTDYVAEDNPGKPLSLGVFGPPGAGKSFGIKQIAQGILGKSAPILTFNLSQFTGPDMLIGALHQVRDEVLKGHIPVVFWDEFDSRGLMWLQYMLAPMNDGEFLEGQVTHPVGKCIFIFAGGTCDCLEDFCTRAPGQPQQAFVNAKGPDFVSRLKGYLNVLGPNPRMIGSKVDASDVGFPIRRAIMLRVQAGCFGSAPLSIDPGLLNAMLKIGAFKHGARSMATIVNLIAAGGKRGLMRCNLPPREQLALHVDDAEFMALVQEGTMFKLRAEDLAPHVHDFYLDLAKKEGWKPDYPMAYIDLPDDIKQDNIAAARRLPDVLALAGLIVVPAGDGSAAAGGTVSAIIEQNIELLAEAEHDGWMESKLISGWRLAEKRDNARRLHPSLVPYNDLRQVDKDKDRNAVRRYLEIAERAGFAVRVEGEGNAV